MKNFKNYTINRKASCLEALKKLNIETSNQTLFVVDDKEHLVGTVTDGDIRRGLIRGLSIDTPVIEFSNPDFSFINGKIDVYKIQKLKKGGIRVLPKLNAEGQIERVFDLSRLNAILPINVLIMAGGRGERLRPLTDRTPKSMLPLGNKPIIEHNIDRLISFGIDSITISVRYLSDQIISYFGDGSEKGISISYIEEDAPLGTIGCLSLIKNVKYDSVLVLNSDIFTSIDYESFYLNFINAAADMAVASIPYTVDIPYAIMELSDNSVVDFEEKPKNTYYANAGIYLIKKEYIHKIPKDAFYNATDLMKQIITANGKLVHSPIAGFWIDIGKHDDYIKAMEIVKHL